MTRVARCCQANKQIIIPMEAQKSALSFAKKPKRSGGLIDFVSFENSFKYNKKVAQI